MATELTLDSLKEMKKAEYIKAFKNKAVWKKAKAVIVMVDYKLDGKKAVIAIPFKKENEMKAEMKRLKKEKLHLLKKTGGGSIEFMPSAEGMKAKIDIKIGGLAPELLITKGQELFDRIKATIEALQSAEAAVDAAEADTEEDEEEDDVVDTTSDEEVEEADEEETDDNWEKAEAASEKEEDEEEGEKPDDGEAKKEKRNVVYEKIKENVGKMEAVAGKADKEKMSVNIKKYEDALQKLIAEAKADGKIDAEEQAAIDGLTNKLTDLKDKVNTQEPGKGTKDMTLSPEKKEAINKQLSDIDDFLNKVSQKYNISI